MSQRLKETPEAKKILAKVDAYAAYYRKVKRQAPPSVHLYSSDFKKLGVNPGYVYNGMTLERYQGV